MKKNTTPPDRQLRPPRLTPPDTGSGSSPGTSRMLPLLAFFLVFLLVLVAGYYFFVIPAEQNSGEISAQSPAPAIEKQPQSRQIEHAVQDEERVAVPRDDSAVQQDHRDQRDQGDLRDLEFSEKARGQWLKLQAETEADGIADWGGKAYTSILQDAAHADQLMDERQYAGAQSEYQNAITALDSLRKSKPTLLASALTHGNDALMACDTEAAVAAFTRASLLDSTGISRAAGQGLRRAGTLEQVCGMYKKALTDEKKGDLQAAKQILLQATSLDGEFKPAVRLLTEVKTRIAEKEFNTAIALFLKAITAGDEKAAATYLTRAETSRPQSPMVRDGKRELRALATRLTLSRFQKSYTKAENAEQWQAGLDVSRKALKVDPQAGFALAGLKKAKHRVALDKAMLKIINYPTRLQEEAVLAQSRQTLAAARSVSSSGPKLKKQIVTVERILAGANRQVEVVLRSDNATEVVVYRVGRLGRFVNRTLQLRPGRYTVVGSRPGYRDVRLKLDIQPDDKQAEITIRCMETI